MRQGRNELRLLKGFEKLKIKATDILTDRSRKSPQETTLLRQLTHTDHQRQAVLIATAFVFLAIRTRIQVVFKGSSNVFGFEKNMLSFWSTIGLMGV